MTQERIVFSPPQNMTLVSQYDPELDESITEWNSLTEAERRLIINKKRFAGFKAPVYQGPYMLDGHGTT